LKEKENYIFIIYLNLIKTRSYIDIIYYKSTLVIFNLLVIKEIIRILIIPRLKTLRYIKEFY